MKFIASVKKFVSSLLGSAEQERHAQVLSKYTLPPHSTMPQPIPHPLANATTHKAS
jgi:hypothetical protein